MTLNALFITYYFPPKGGAGVQRSAKFARDLPTHGISPIVVTGPDTSQSRWDPLDPSLTSDVANVRHIYRASSSAPTVKPGRLSRLVGTRAPFDAWWEQEVLTLGERASREHSLDAVYVSLSPFSTWAPAQELARRLDVPLVADLRDPWALDEVLRWPSRLHRSLAMRRMSRLCDATDRIIFNTPEARESAAHSVASKVRERIRVITNGFDADDFAGPAPALDESVFRIVHVGTFHSRLARQSERRGMWASVLGGGRSRPDHWGRSPKYLLQALESCPRMDSEGRQVELHQYGALTPEDEECLAQAPAVTVVGHGFQPHSAAIPAMRSADLLFLPMYGLPGRDRARIVPGKTYEYLASARPILAGLPLGDARDMVIEADAGEVVTPGDIGALSRAIQAALARGRVPDRPIGEDTARFERRRLSSALAEIIVEASGAGSSPAP